MSSSQLTVGPVPFVLNQHNADIAKLQICARAAGRVPPDFLGQQNVSLAHLDQVLMPLERTSVIYQSTQNITHVFFQLLMAEKLEGETQRQVIRIKDKLIALFQRYQHTDPQLNILKLLSIRCFANINKLLKTLNLKQFHIALDFKRLPTYKLGELKSASLSEALKLCAQQITSYLYLLGQQAEGQQIEWPDSFSIQMFQEVFSSLLTQVSDPKTRILLSNLNEDFELAKGLLLAPRVLIPLAIRPFDVHLRTSDAAFKEIGEMLEEYFEFVSRIITDNKEKAKGELKKFCDLFLKDYQPCLKQLFHMMRQLQQQAFTFQGRAIDYEPVRQKLIEQIKGIHSLTTQSMQIYPQFIAITYNGSQKLDN